MQPSMAVRLLEPLLLFGTVLQHGLHYFGCWDFFKAPLLQLGMLCFHSNSSQWCQASQQCQKKSHSINRGHSPLDAAFSGCPGSPCSGLIRYGRRLQCFRGIPCFPNDSGVYTSFCWSHLIVISIDISYVSLTSSLKIRTTSSSLFLSVSNFSIGSRRSLFIVGVSKRVKFSSPGEWLIYNMI